MFKNFTNSGKFLVGQQCVELLIDDFIGDVALDESDDVEKKLPGIFAGALKNNRIEGIFIRNELQVREIIGMKNHLTELGEFGKTIQIANLGIFYHTNNLYLYVQDNKPSHFVTPLSQTKRRLLGE